MGYRTGNGMVMGLLLSLAVFLASCSGDNVTPPNRENGEPVAKSDVTPTKKGKTIDKDNMLIRPLTLAESNIAGKVKFISYRRQSLGRWGRKVLISKGYFSYNTAGYLLCHNEYKKDGAQQISCLYSYDDKNQATEWNVTDMDNGRESKIIFNYDAKGNITEEIMNDKDPKFSMKSTFRYDNVGNETQEKDYFGDSKLKQIISCKYDINGNQTEQAYRTAPDLIVHKKVTCTYDAKGNEAGGKKYISDTAVVVKWTCKNNDSGKCIEKVFYTGDGAMTMRNTFKYDAKGNLSEYNYYRADGSLNEEDSYALEYVYDKTGNIIKQTKLVRKSGKLTPAESTEYDIVYF